MFKPLETERLLMKNIGPEDAAFFYKQFSTDAVNAYLYDAEPVASLAEAQEWVALYTQPEPRAQHRWVLVRRADGEKIGTCGFHCWDRENASAEIGYDLQPAYWRQGYMTEALTAALRFAGEEMRLQRVFAHIAQDHLPSLKTAEKLGFTPTGGTFLLPFHGREYRHFIYEKRMAPGAPEIRRAKALAGDLTERSEHPVNRKH